MVRNRGERPLLTAPKNEYNFIFYPTFEPNLRAITKSVLLHEKSTCPRTAFHPERIPRPSRRIGAGFWVFPGEGRGGFLLRPPPFFVHPAFFFTHPAPIYNKEKIIK